MVSKVTDFFESYRIDYEGIDLGANSDALPPSLARAIESWLLHWDPRRLKPSCLWAPTPRPLLFWAIAHADEASRKHLELYLHAEYIRRLPGWQLTPFNYSVDWFTKGDFDKDPV